MAYAKIDVSAVFSDNSDYSFPIARTQMESYELSSPTKYLHQTFVPVTTPGTAIELGMFTTIALLVIHNQSASIAVTAAFTSNSTANVPSIPANGMLVQSNVTVANDLTIVAASGTPSVEIFIVGT